MLKYNIYCVVYAESNSECECGSLKFDKTACSLWCSGHCYGTIFAAINGSFTPSGRDNSSSSKVSNGASHMPRKPKMMCEKRLLAIARILLLPWRLKICTAKRGEKEVGGIQVWFGSGAILQKHHHEQEDQVT